jgi:hypothetical protein
MTDITLIATLILLHQVDGRPVRINPEQVTQIFQPRDESEKKQLHNKVKCVLRFTDGSYLSVAEECETVQRNIAPEGVEAP